MNLSRAIVVAAVLALSAGCSASEGDAPKVDGPSASQSSTNVAERRQTSVGILQYSSTNSYSEDELLFVASGTPAEVEAVVECDGPDYGLVIESHQNGEASPLTVVGSAQAQARISPDEMAAVLEDADDEVVSRYDRQITSEAGGYVGLLVTTTGSETVCAVKLTDASTGEVLADEDVVSNDIATGFPLYFPRPGDTGNTRRILAYPSGDPVLPGYPVKVSGASIDYRVIGYSGSTDQEFVALAPGVYAPYTPVEPDLTAYLDGPSKGDCTVRAKLFPGTGGTCWSGVAPGSEEPPL